MLVGAALAAGLVLLFLRRPNDLLTPTLWVDDFEVFFLQQHFMGFSPLMPFAGGLYVIQRTVAFLASLLPTLWVPYAYNATAILLNLVAPAVLLQGRAEAIIPSFAGRLIAFFLLILNPIASEVHGTVTNVHWPLAISLSVILLLPPPRTSRGRVLELVAVAIIALTGFSALFALPCLLAGLMQRPRSPYLVGRAAVALAALSIQLSVLVLGGVRSASPSGILSDPVLATQVIALRWGAARVLAEALARDNVHWWLVMIPSVAVGLVILGCAGWLALRRQGVAHAALLASACVGVLSAMVGLGDKLSRLLFPPLDGRYFYGAVGILGVIAAGALLAPRRSLAAVVLAAGCAVGALEGFVLKPKPPRDWREFVACFDAHRGVCTTTINPNRLVTVHPNGHISVTGLMPPPEWQWWPKAYWDPRW